MHDDARQTYDNFKSSPKRDIPDNIYQQVIDESDEKRLLYRCAEGGFMWMHGEDDGLIHRSSLVSDDEARRFWAEHLLYFTDEEQRQLTEKLQVGRTFNEMLESVLGWKRVSRSFYAPDTPSTEVLGCINRIFCAHNGGLVRAITSEHDTIIDLRSIQGEEAWEIIQPWVDPQGHREKKPP